MLYSVYAIYASGKDAVLGGMLVMAVGFVIWGFIAPRFGSIPVNVRQDTKTSASRKEQVA
jgi:putrescine:ornithine antiporter